MAILSTIWQHPSILLLLDAQLLLLLFTPPFRAQDCSALHEFRDALLHNSQMLSIHDWDYKTACCKWKGITCGSGVVTVMNLASSNLKGAIPSVSKLPGLTHLILSNNNFYGDTPDGLSFLSHLQHLDLSNNSLGPRIPVDIITKSQALITLRIAGNHFQGQMPAPNIILRELTLLDFGNNNFSAWDLSKICKNCVNLITLDVGGNKLGNTWDWNFLTSLAQCKKLKELDLSNNGFKGPLPESIGSLPRTLVRLNLRGNNLVGSIPTGIQNLNQLATLDMGSTSLSGTIPSSMNKLIQLQMLSLDNNNLTGGLDEVLFSLQNLRTLNISSNNLSGGIPFNLSKCTNLQVLNLQHNHFNGTIPEFLGKMANLKFLDLSLNDLTGPIPAGKIFESKQSFVYDRTKLCGGNAALQLAPCPESGVPPVHTSGSPPGQPGGDSPRVAPMVRGGSGFPKAALVIIIIIAVLFMWLVLFWLLYKRNCITYKYFQGFAKEITLLKAPLRLSCSDLQTATRGFSSTYLIGSGGIGSVYRGFLEQAKKEVAVKVLKEDTSGDSKSFLEECHSISMITHRNLVKMLTSCVNVEIEGNPFKALIYEFMPNGNLEMWLHEEVASQAMSFKKWNLNLYQRLSMAIDVASLLVHLHCDFETPIVHCNLKPGNILISEDMTAHVTDFGMNKIFKVDMIVRNSAGYTAPECSARSPISPTWDVYSFGVILLEMFTGKRPTDEDFGGTSSLRKYVLHGYPTNIEEIIDPLLLSEETSGKLTNRSRECIISILNTALMCSKEVPGERMIIQVAREKLEKAESAFLEVGGDEEMQHTIDREGSSMAMLV